MTDDDDRNWVDDLLATFAATPVSYLGMPGMAVSFVVPEEGVRESEVPPERTLVLLETLPGLPVGLRVSRPDAIDPPAGRFALNPRLGMDFCRRWLSGEAAWKAVLGSVDPGLSHPLSLHGARALRTLRGVAAAALPASGFSPAFLEALACLDGFVSLPAGNWETLFGRDAEAASVRAFALRYPLVAEMRLNEARRSAARHGEVRPEDLAPGFDHARSRKLSAHAWDRRTYDDMEHPCSGPLSRAVPPGPPDVVGLCAALPVEWLPGDRKGIDAFLELAGFLTELGRTATSPLDLLRTSRGDWAPFLERCVEGIPHGAGSGLSELREHMSSAAADVALRLVAPLLAKAGIRRDPVPLGGWLLYGGKGLPACRETAILWHKLLPDILERLPDEGDEDATPWPSLLAEAEHGGVRVVPLLTGLDVREEGSPSPDRNGVPGLAHCVASYRGRARQGLCHIVSLRGPGRDGSPYERLATAELVQDWRGRLGTVQLTGRGNGPAPACAAFALQAYVAAADLPLMPRRDHRTGDWVRDACGYDWSDARLLDDACAAYAPLLRRDHRGGHEVLTAALVARAGEPVHP